MISFISKIILLYFQSEKKIMKDCMKKITSILLFFVVACSIKNDDNDSKYFFSSGVKISYELLYPQQEAQEKYPAVVVGHGSGKVTKEDMFWAANFWLERGYAFLLYDKRGFGNSGGSYADLKVSDNNLILTMAKDMAAAVRILKKDKRIDKNKIGLFGVSQAGWTIPVVSTLELVDFALIIVGPTVSVGLEIFYSRHAEYSKLCIDQACLKLEEFNSMTGFDPAPYLQKINNTKILWLYDCMVVKVVPYQLEFVSRS